MLEEEALSGQVLAAAIEVHRALGPGLLESVYEECLALELLDREIPFQRQVPLPISFKGRTVECGFRMDLVVSRRIVIELKSVEKMQPVHEAQLLTYMKLAGLRVGFLLNFNVPVLKDGIRRRVL